MRPTTIPEVQSAVREYPRVLPRGGGSKPALSTPAEGVTPLDLSAIAGMVEYEPGEFTFTALAGTRLADVTQQLDQHGQYLPFDPLLVERGATLGGTVAAGVSGPGRYRYGGVRDFLLGVRFVNDEGQVVRGGGKVVKNAAGFDIPKLMVGSLGRLGALVELSFKVFPRPEAYVSLRLNCARLDEALQALVRLYTSQLDIDALELEPTASGAELWVRLGGLADALPARLDRLRALLGGGEPVEGSDEATIWRNICELAWGPAGWSVIKVPLTPRRIAALEHSLTGVQARRRYSGGGQVAWIASPESLPTLDALLNEQGLSGLVVWGPPGQSRLGIRVGESFERRVKAALDPAGRFVEA
ncbi:MAG TPA: FAD-binding protein [Anaerolineae bacterium]|nr:FAD-binding protein [Anaerolineae bacterium]